MREQHVARPLGTGIGVGGDFFQRTFAETGGIREMTFDLLCIRFVRAAAEASFQPAEA